MSWHRTLKDTPVDLHSTAPYVRHLSGIGLASRGAGKVSTGINAREVGVCQNRARTEELVQALGEVLLLKRSVYQLSFLLVAAAGVGQWPWADKPKVNGTLPLRPKRCRTFIATPCALGERIARDNRKEKPEASWCPQRIQHRGHAIEAQWVTQVNGVVAHVAVPIQRLGIADGASNGVGGGEAAKAVDTVPFVSVVTRADKWSAWWYFVPPLSIVATSRPPE